MFITGKLVSIIENEDKKLFKSDSNFVYVRAALLGLLEGTIDALLLVSSFILICNGFSKIITLFHKN